MDSIPEAPKAISLWSSEGDHAGFMLLSIRGQEAGEYVGECVFLLSPVSTDGLESQMGIVVSELKVAGEHPLSLKWRDGGLSIVVTPADLPAVNLRIVKNERHSVVTDSDGRSVVIGVAEEARGKS